MRKSLLVLCSLFVLSIFAPAVAQAAPVDFELVRQAPRGDAVYGTLTEDKEHHTWNTLERNGNKPNTDIPWLAANGRYEIVVDRSEIFSNRAGEDVFLPHILNVRGRTGIRIHSGTKPEHSTGCVLVEPGNNVEKIKELIENDAKSNKKSWITIRNYQRPSTPPAAQETSDDDDDDYYYRSGIGDPWRRNRGPGIDCTIL